MREYRYLSLVGLAGEGGVGGVTRVVMVNWGRILGRNWDKSLKSFPSYYSPQLTLLTDFTPPSLEQKWLV
jgi:hypothetical protein